jgi:hypothetical protein
MMCGVRRRTTLCSDDFPILINELHVGRLVWNRQRFLKNPETGKRVARLNPQSEWIVTDVPALRIVDDALWSAVRARYATIHRKWHTDAPPPFNQFRRPKYLFSGLTKCGACGAGFIVYSRDHLGCFGARGRGSCDNRMTIPRQEVEERVLRALQDRLMRADYVEEFCREFSREMNRLRIEQRAGLTAAKRELSRVESRRQKLLDLMLDGVVSSSEGKDEMLDLTARRDALRQQIKTADEPPPLLHPSVAAVYQTKIEELASSLQREDTRTEASDALRGLIDAIVLTPENGRLRVELKGNLAAMLTVAQETKRSPETGDLLVPVQLVAGAGFEPSPDAS